MLEPGFVHAAAPAPLPPPARAAVHDLLDALREYARGLSRVAVTIPTLTIERREFLVDLAQHLRQRSQARCEIAAALAELGPGARVGAGPGPTTRAVREAWSGACAALARQDLQGTLAALGRAERALAARRKALLGALPRSPLRQLLAGPELSLARRPDAGLHADAPAA